MDKDLSHFLNNKNFRKRRTARDIAPTTISKHSDLHWSTSENERFLNTLPKTGLDFTMLSTFFPNKSRKQLVAKYKRELKRDKERIEQLVQSQRCFVNIERSGEKENEKSIKYENKENIEQENKENTEQENK